MVSHKINLDVILIPDDSKLKKSLDTLINSFQNKLMSSLNSSVNLTINKPVTDKTDKEEKKDKEDKEEKNILIKLLSISQTAIGVLTGIFGILNKVPSILQASLKLMGIGFLLILKPLADLLGMILMPIGIAMVKLAAFLMKYSGGAGLGGLIGLVLGAILAVILAASVGSPLIVTGLLVLFGMIVGAILGSIIGAIAEWAQSRLVNLEREIIKFAFKVLGIDTEKEHEGFWGGILDAVIAWVTDTSDLRSFISVLVDSIFGWNISGEVKDLVLKVLAGAFGPLGGMAYELTKKEEKKEPVYGKNLDAVANAVLASAGPIPWLYGKIAGLADGGIATKPTQALIGEAGPEAVIPLDKLGGMGGVNINVNGIFEEDRLRDIMRGVAEDVLYSHKQVTGSVF